MGVPLFVRTPQGIKPTEFAHTLRKEVGAYINHHDRIVTAIRDMKNNTRSHISLALMNGLYDYLPQGFLSTFLEKYPEISLDIANFPAETFQSSMEEQQIAMGFYSGPAVSAEVFDSIGFIRYPIVVITGVKHPLASRPSVRLEDLRNETVIMTNDRRYTSFIAKVRSRGKITSVMLLTPFEITLAYDLCATGRMVGIHAGPIDRYPDLVCIPVEGLEDEYWDIHLVVNKSACLNDAAKAFIAYAKEQLFPDGV